MAVKSKSVKVPIKTSIKPIKPAKIIPIKIVKPSIKVTEMIKIMIKRPREIFMESAVKPAVKVSLESTPAIHAPIHIPAKSAAMKPTAMKPASAKSSPTPAE